MEKNKKVGVPAKKTPKTDVIKKNNDSKVLYYAQNGVPAQAVILTAFLGVVIWLVVTQGVLGAVLAFLALLFAVLYICKPKE